MGPQAAAGLGLGARFGTCWFLYEHTHIFSSLELTPKGQFVDQMVTGTSGAPPDTFTFSQEVHGVNLPISLPVLGIVYFLAERLAP